MYTPNGTLFGFYRALVVSAKDPEKQGRVRVRIPDIMVDKGWGTGDWCENGIWARPANNWIGGRNIYDTKGPRCNHEDAWYQGSCMIPPKGSHVFVFFEKGDPSHPFYFAAADYGQTKVLPENRVGSQWWKKWTPIKTREGRTFVISDDKDDARVELTGKKRKIHNTPDGDTKSVFDIAENDATKFPGNDGNQSVVLIDERPDHEKILIKDYRGNFIKMIQNEAGLNDQLHIVMKDDIHLETKKNIYIYAHENIHITARKNIYITTELENMHVKVKQEFREMAHLINRYSETNDNRLAEIDINDNANNTCARNAVNIVRDMAGSMCSRASSGKIADGAAGAMSIMAGAIMSVLGGGGTLIDGAFVSIENGSAPIPPSTGIKPATMAKKATLPKPDPDRHFKSTDDNWNPKVDDKNDQYKPHGSFWKPHYKWSPTSQTDNSTTTAGGGAPEGNGTSINENDAGSENVQDSSTTQNSANDGSNEDYYNEDNTTSTEQNNSNSAQNQNNPASITDEINDVLNNNPNSANQNTSDILKSTENTIDSIRNNIINNVENGVAKVKEVINNLNTKVDNVAQQTLKNKILDVVTDVTNDKSDKISKSINKKIDMDVDIDQDIKKIKNEIDDKIDETSSKKEIEDASVEVIYDIEDEVITNIINDLKKGVQKTVPIIDDELTDDFKKYDNLTKDSLNKVMDNSTKSRSIIPIDNFNISIINSINTGVENLLKSENLDYNLKYDDLYSSISSLKNEFINEYVDDIDLDLDIYDKTIQNIKENIENQSNNYINTVVTDNVNNDISNFIHDELSNVVTEAMKHPDNISGIITNSINNVLNNTIDNIKNNIKNNFIAPIISNGIKDIDNILDSKIDPLTKIDNINNKILVEQLNKQTRNGLIDNILEYESIESKNNERSVKRLMSFSARPILTQDNKNNINIDGIDFPDIHNKDVSGLPETIQKTIIDSLPTSNLIMDYINSDMNTVITDYVDDVTDGVLTPLDDIINSLSDPIESSLNNSIPTIQKQIVKEDLYINYSDLCGWDQNEKSFDKFMFDNINGITNNISDKIMLLLNDSLKTKLQIPTTPIIDKSEVLNFNFISNISYGVGKGFLNVQFITTSLIGGIQKDIDDYFKDKDITDRNKCNDLIKDTCINVALFNPSNKIKQNLDYDPNDDEDLDNLIIDSLNGLESRLDECKSKDETIPNAILDKMEDVINPLTNIQQYIDIINKQLSSSLDKSIGDDFNPLIPAIIDIIEKDISSGLKNQIVNNVKNKVGIQLNELKEMCENTRPNNWSTDEIIRGNHLIDVINNYYDVLDNLNDYLRSDPINITNIIVQNIREDVSKYLPTKDNFNEALNDKLNDTFKKLCNYIKDVCKRTIILTDNIKDNEFDRNLDLTKIYTIPGVKSSKCHCIATSDDIDSLWCDPEIIGGCGCIYEYMLFLKDKYYNTIPQILVNDSIKTIGVSLNPILDNLKDTLYIFHDINIINDYNKLIQDIYDGKKIDVESNRYVNRIDSFMTICEQFDFTCIVNLVDFTYQLYMWLQNIPDMEKYTHDMVDDKFVQFITLLVNHLYYNNGRRRLCRILLNLGNGSFINPADKENEKYSIYPNCGFIRELIMKLVYKCKITSNYMCITANESNNLYYYNPYSEFKCYDDNVQHELKDYEICVRDCVDNKSNGKADVIIYDKDNNISAGYAKFYTSCSEKSYPMSYVYDLMELANQSDGNKTILEKYTLIDNEIDPNIMNEIFTPNARKVMRYFYKGHKNYFSYHDLKFDNNGIALEDE